MNRLIVSFFFCFTALFLIGQEEVSFEQKFDLPVRLTRTFGVSGNVGLKSLTGLGVSIQYYVVPKIAIDAGVGISNYGFNLSGRGRFIFTKSNFAPFAGLGFIYGTGSNGQPVSVTDVETVEEIWYVLDPSRFIQVVGGAEYVTKKGLFIMFDGGISILTNPGNYNLVSGDPRDAMIDSLDLIYGTGFVTEVSIGYIFGNKKGYRGNF